MGVYLPQMEKFGFIPHQKHSKFDIFQGELLKRLDNPTIGEISKMCGRVWQELGPEGRQVRKHTLIGLIFGEIYFSG